jgi:two-component system phosphate regulon sensor histidine kinase PhoR
VDNKNHRLLIALVSVTISVTIAIQGYWNYVSYKANKVELINQVQISLDKAVESYYADIAKGHIVTVSANEDTVDGIGQFRHIIKQRGDIMIDSIHKDAVEFKSFSGNNAFHLDTIMKFKNSRWSTTTAINLETTDRLHINQMDTAAISIFASKIFVSMNNDSFDFDELSSLIKSDFETKNWPIDFGLLLRSPDCVLPTSGCDTLQLFGSTHQKGQLVVASQSAFIPNASALEIHFSNISSILMKRSLIGILLSLLLSGAIIFCLLYLFRTINEQKQLAEIKNDLISNITHEFKTPITTISTALEGIENFSGLDDIVKTKKYIGISNSQLGKLNTMVEKLLETASIDSEHLTLNTQREDLTELIDQLLTKYQISQEAITFNFDSASESVFCNVDKFHIESAIGNLIDNAIKYGNGEVSVSLTHNIDKTVSILVKDNGIGIPKNQRTKIFDKFYRIPTGNVHDVKGFGIGLYYAKHIVEKHEGRLELDHNSELTTFKITLTHAS